MICDQCGDKTSRRQGAVDRWKYVIKEELSDGEYYPLKEKPELGKLIRITLCSACR